MAIEISIERTPNPKALKFILNRTVKNGGKVTYRSETEADQPLVRDLFAISHVNQVHLFENVITVSQTGDGDWEQIVSQVEAVIQTRMPVHDPDYTPQSMPVKKDRSHLSEDLQKIEEILDRTVRPGLQGDGGDLEVVSYENNLLIVNFQGACGGCPSSTMGTLYAIEGILQQEFNPEIKVQPQGMDYY